MTCTDEFWNDCGANEACSPSEKDTHCLLLLTAHIDEPSGTWLKINGDSLRLQLFLRMATKRSKSQARKPRADAERNRDRVLEGRRRRSRGLGRMQASMTLLNRRA